MVEVPAFEKGGNDFLKLSKISLTIDHYDDIFSDFDSRPYSERALSDDFLQEMKRAVRDKPSGVIELRFLIPHLQRSFSHEHLIKQRLHSHFVKHYEVLQKEHKSIRRRGFGFAFAGISMIVLASYVAYLEISSFLYHLLMILLEPGGWFLGWTGLDELFYTLKEHTPEVLFYEKMTRCEIHFLSY